MKIHNGKRIKLKAVLTGGILAILCAVFGFANISFPGKVKTADATAVGATELVLSSEEGAGATATSRITSKQTKAYKQLISAIAKGIDSSKTASNYKALTQLLGTGTVSAAKFTDYKVKFGGYTWNIAYVSTTRATSASATALNTSVNAVGDAGDIVVTLYLADNGTRAGLPSNIVSQFSDLATDNTSVTYPSSMYSTSIVRASLNGTERSANNNSIVSTTPQNAAWQRFTAEDQLGQYISTPAQVAYQETEYTSTYTYYFPNDAYGKVSGVKTWYNATNRDIKQIQEKNRYGDWRTDKLWLPSMSETGWDSTNVGMWGLSATQRANTNSDNTSATTAAGDTRYCWLRSGYYGYAYGAYLLYSSGGVYHAYRYYSVRPALHLNLKSAASAAGVELPAQVENAAYNGGNKVAALENVSENIEIASAKLTQTHRDNTTEVKNLTASDYEIKDGGLYAALAGTYEAEFKLVSPGEDLPIWDGTTLNPDSNTPARMDGGEYIDEVLYWEIPNPANPDQPVWTIENQKVKFTVKKATPAVTNVQYTDAAKLYSGGTLPSLSHAGTAGEAKLDEGQTLKESQTSYNWTFYPTDDLNYNDSAKGTVELQVFKPELKLLEATFDAAAYGAAVAAGTAGKIYSSATLAEVKNIIKEYVTIDTALKEDGNPFEDVAAIKSGYTLGYEDDKTKLEGGKDNTLSLNYGGVTCTLRGDVPVLTVDLVSISVNTNPTKRTYTALETFNPAGMVITATYTDGKKKAVIGYTWAYTGDREELWADDTFVTISYMERNELSVAFTKETTVTVTVNKINFYTNDVTLQNASKPYTGAAQTIALGGAELPEGINAKYSFELKNAPFTSVAAENVINVVEGGYKVIVQLETDEDRGINYAIQGSGQLNAVLTITKVDYDGVGDIAFEDGEAQYSASSKAGSIEVTGLPDESVTVNYTYYSDADCTQSLNEADVVNMGEYYVKAEFTVDGNHNDIQPKTAKLTVIAHKITEGEITGVESSYVYKGEAWKPEPAVTVTLGGVPAVLTKSADGVNGDYTVAYSTEDFAAGTLVKVTVTGIGNFSDSVDIEFTVTKATLKLTWENDGHGAGCVYNGAAHSAVITIDADTVCDADRSAITSQALAQLIADGISFITYSATSGGNSSVTAAGVYKPRFTSYPTETSPWSNYKYEFTNADFTFTVGEAVLPEITFEDKTVTYNGDKHFVYISANGVETQESALCNGEVEVKYYNGTLTNAFTGKSEVSADPYSVRAVIRLLTDNYSFPADFAGTVAADGKSAELFAELTVTPKEIGAAGVENEGVTVSGILAEYVYNGKDVTPDVVVKVVLKDGEEARQLKADGTEYELSYAGDRLNAGLDGSFVTVTVAGKGNYGGTVEKTFKIKKASLTLKWIGLEDTYVYNGAPQGVTAEFEGVAERDKATVVPTVYYLNYADYINGDYTVISKPENAGKYIAAVRLAEADKSPNYADFADQWEEFSIGKATPIVSDPKYVSYDGVSRLFVGQLLPEITLNTASLNTVITEVAGTVAWKEVDGAQPVLALNMNSYVWVFAPDDTRNFESVEGTLSLQAFEPQFASVTVRWLTDDGLQPFLWSSTTLEDLRDFLWVEALMDDGTNFGRVTTLYSLSGSWGTAASPKLAGSDETLEWDITLGLQSVTYKLENVKYNVVTLDHIEVVAADGAEIKKQYDALSKFDTDSISVIAHFKDGSKTENVTGYKLEYQQSDERLWFGNTSVTVSYKYLNDVATATVSGLSIRQIVFDTSSVKFASASVTLDYDGTARSVKLQNEADFTIGKITYTYYRKDNNGDWVALSGVSEVTDAGEYRIDAVFAIVDDPLIGEGVYTRNYNLDVSRKLTYLTINKIKYAGADGVSFASAASAVYNGGDTAKLYEDAIKAAATGVSEEIWAIAGYEYRTTLTGPVLTAQEAVHAGNYVVTVIFYEDVNHEPISPVRISLTVEQAESVINPKLVGHALKGISIMEIHLENDENGTSGYFTWVSYGNFDPSTYVLHTNSNLVYYTFTPDNTRDYKSATSSYTIMARENYPVYMYASVSQGDTELFTSYSLEKLLELAADETKDLSIGVYMVFNDGTTEQVSGYDVKLASGGEMLDRDAEGKCYLVFTYTLEGEEFTFDQAYVTVHVNGLGSIVATFEQNGEKIFTSGDVDTVLKLIEDGKVSLTVNSYYADGDFKAELAAYEYALSGDWSGLTADGEYSVAVTMNGETVSTTFKIDVTLVVLTEITADFDQNGKSVHASDDISVLENMISGGDVKLTVTAIYNDGSENAVDFGGSGYSVSIATALFEVGTTTVTVSYGEGGVDKTATFDVEVTAVLVERLYAKINDVDRKIYTDTALTDVADLLTVKAYYNDGTEAEVSDFALVMPDGSYKLTAGTQVTVNVGYTGADIADYFNDFELIIGVIKHDTIITFTGKTVYSYDGSAHDVDAGATTNHADDEIIKYEIDGLAAKIMGAKEYTLVITSEETDDYYPATKTVTITVNKADYDLSDVVFEGKNVVYDGTKQYLTVSGSLPMNVYLNGYSYVDGDGAACAEASATNAGVYTVTVSFGAFDTVNYNAIPDLKATLTIEKAEVAIDESGLFAPAYIYSGVEQTVTGATIVKADDGAEIIYNNNTFTGVPAGGVLAVEITVEESANFKAFSKVVEISVSKAALTLSVNGHSITFGDKPANDGVTADGFVNGEEIEDLDGTLVYAYNYSQYGSVGEYVISVGGVSSANYEITLIEGKLTVEQKEVPVDWTVESYVYDGKAHSPAATFTDLFDTEIALTVSISNGSGSVNEAISAGDYLATASSLNPNYKLTGNTHGFIIISDTDNWIRFDFRKDYAVSYGSVPETAEELAALTETLINQSFVRVEFNVNSEIVNLDTVIKLMTVRLEVDSDTLVTSHTPVGRYNICFEFKPEYADAYATYRIYQTVEASDNTNLGRLAIEPRKLTVDWGKTEFKHNEEVHLLTATVTGFIDGDTPVSFTMTENGGEFSFEIDEANVKFSLATVGDFLSVGGHSVEITVDNGNYVITNPYATVSITPDKSVGNWLESITPLTWGLIVVAAVAIILAIIAIIVAAKRKNGAAVGGGDYDDGGFNEPYYGDY